MTYDDAPVAPGELARALAKALRRLNKPDRRGLYEGGVRSGTGPKFSTQPQDSEDHVYTHTRGGGQYSVGGEKD